MSIFTLPEGVDDCLLDALSPCSLLRYSRTCKTAYSIVQDYMKHAFCVDRLLSRYFSPAEIFRFRELQYRTGALISGSTALQFFDRDTYPDSDLDVYVEHRFVRALTEWLVDIGYKYTPLSDSADMATLDAAFATNPPGREYTPPHPVNIFAGEDYLKSSFVFNFEKKHPKRTIQLITSLICPLQCILDFHSTCVMNVIAHDKAYSFFPKTTLEERLSLRRHQAGDATRDLAVQKYLLRGWSIINPPAIPVAVKRQVQAEFPVGGRYVGDRTCWTLRVHPALALPCGYVEANSWYMAVSSRVMPMITATIMSARELKFRYTLSPIETSVAKGQIRALVMSLNKATAVTSDTDADFLRALKRYRGDKDEDADSPGGHP